jgi:hypothetical protein
MTVKICGTSCNKAAEAGRPVPPCGHSFATSSLGLLHTRYPERRQALRNDGAFQALEDPLA